jgi:hypothetical protein
MYTKCKNLEDVWRLSIRCHLKMSHMEHHDIGTCEMWAKVKNIRIISTNATRG